jgi:hypothetical protein
MSPPVPRQGKITQIGATGAEVIRRRLVLGAIGAQPEEPARHHLAHLRRPAAARDPRAAALERRRSRTRRIIANVTIEESAGAACTVRSKSQLLEYRREAQRVFGGTLNGFVADAHGS